LTHQSSYENSAQRIVRLQQQFTFGLRKRRAEHESRQRHLV
jgi:hypothetical protein